MLSLLDYRSVVALSEHRHFARASEHLGITQPALTARLRRIEQELGARLFERGRGGVEPTPTGFALIDAALQVLEAAELAERTAHDAAAGYGQVLRLGLTQYAAVTVAGRILATFREQHPHTRIRVIEDSTAGLERALERRALDAAILHPPLQATVLSEQPLHRAGTAVYGPAGSGTAETLVRYPRDEAPVVMSALAQADFARAETRTPYAEANSILAALVLSSAGYGRAAVPEDYPCPVLDPPINRIASSRLTLDTTLAWHSLDRRPLVRALRDCA